MSAGAYKTKHRVNYSTAKAYKEFKAKYPEVDITAQQYVAIIKTSNELISTAIIENPYGFKLPSELGYIAIDKFKPKSKTISSGDLIIGKKYTILYYGEGDDFTNVGAATNSIDTVFIATGRMPNNYRNGSTLKVESRIKPVDWITTNQTGKLTYLTNLHSFGYIYVIKIYKNPNKKNIDCYVFKPQKELKQALAKKIKGGKDYHKLDRSFFSRRFSIDKIFKNMV